PGVGTYRPAYRPSKTGRMFEIGGGAQCFSRDFKRAAYHLPNVFNYDLRSSQLMGLLEVWAHYSDIERDVLLIEYVSNKQSKFRYAAQAGMDVDLWKQCLLSLFFGASLYKNM